MGNRILKSDEYNKYLKIKDLFDNNIVDIFDMCHNEIKTSNYDITIISYYTSIFRSCLLETNNLTITNLEFVDNIRNECFHSENTEDVFVQYKRISNNTNIIPSLMLKMINNIKNINIINNEDGFLDILLILIRDFFQDNTYLTKALTSKYLNYKLLII